MNNYDKSIVQFLVNSFCDIIDSYGRTPESIKFFKSQVDSIVKQGKVSIENVELAYDILGVSNTDNIKWTVTNNKINQFNATMSMINEIQSRNNRVRAINMLANNNSISKSVARVAVKIA